MRRASLLLVLIVASCASSPLMRAAKGRDFSRLKTDLVAREKAGTLSASEATDLARVIATSELANAKDADAVKRVRDVLACAADLDGALADRAKTHDAAGGEAALERVDDGEMGEGSARDYVDDPEDTWRAVGARGLVRSSDHDARLKALKDPSPEVRRSASRAAREAHAIEELDALFEAARVDPDPMVRTEAVRAISKLADDSGSGAQTIANRLRDLWTNADDAIREDIAVAFTSRDVFGVGGRDALRVILGEGEGPGAIAAAGAVLRSQPKDAELAASSRVLLARVIAKGSRRSRTHAIALANIGDPDLAKALRDVADDGDTIIRIAALARLASSAKDRDASIKALEEIAGHDDSRLASSARFTLANLGDARVQAWLEEDLASPETHVRLSAASGLAALGRAGRAAPLLADDDPEVRTRAACTLLVAARTHR